VYVGVGGGIGPFHAGVGTRLGGRGGRSGSSGGLDGLGMALVLIAVFLAAWLAVAGLWLVVLAALAVSDFAFAAGRGVGWALGSRNRGESIQAGGILRWSAVRWWCRTGVTRMIWGWAFVPARTVWYFLTYRRGPREWLVDGMWVSGVVALLAGITGAIMIYWTGTNYEHRTVRIGKSPLSSTRVEPIWTWAQGDVEWWAWGTAALAIVMAVTWLACTLLRGFFTPLEQRLEPVVSAGTASAVVLEPPDPVVMASVRRAEAEARDVRRQRAKRARALAAEPVRVPRRPGRV